MNKVMFQDFTNFKKKIKSRFLSIVVVLLVSFAVGCNSLPKEPRPETDIPLLNDPQDTTLYRAIAPLVDARPDQSGFFALPEGVDALAARFQLVEAAESSVDLQYYIWHDDAVGKILFHRLLKAADRGVRIRFLLDDLDTAGKDDFLAKVNAHPNIEIRLFNPFPNRQLRWLDFLSNLNRVNHRMHNKSLTVDSTAAILGGRNIGDEYFNAGRVVGFSDMDVLAVGPVVQELSNSFLLYWSSQWSYPFSQIVNDKQLDNAEIKNFRANLKQYADTALHEVYAKVLRQVANEKYSSVKNLDWSWGKWALVYDQPSKVTAKQIDVETHLAPRLKQALDSTKEDLIIVSPYFVPGTDFTEYLSELVARGVRVRVMTNSLAANDVALVHAGYRRYREDLIRGGVELYEFKPIRKIDKKENEQKNRRWTGSSRSSLHGKYFGFDQRYVFIGSFNLDGRSVSLNTELGVYFESESYAAYLSHNFDQRALERGYRVLLEDGQLRWKTIDNNRLVTYTNEPETSIWQRFINRLLSIFVPEAQL